MLDRDRGWLRRRHPYSYGTLAVLFALPALAGLARAWPTIAAVPDAFPGIWGPVALYSTLLSAGMALRAATPATPLGPDDDRVE